MILLCLVQGSFPLLFAYHGKTDSRVALEFSPFIVDIDSIIYVHVQMITIIEPLPQPLCTNRTARLCVSNLKIDVHGAVSSVGERNITFDSVMLQRFTQHTLQIHTVMDLLC